MNEEKTTKIDLSNEDWDLLLPGEDYTIGKTTINIKPLGLEDFASVIKRFGTLMEEWREVLFQELQNDMNTTSGQSQSQIINQIILILPRIGNFISDHAISVISDMSGITEDSIRKMPPKIASELFSKCLEVNIQSQKGLEKNFVSLKDQIVNLIQGPSTEKEEETKLEEPSKP